MFFISIVVFFLSFYIPGRVLLRKVGDLKGIENLVLPVGLGISLWGLQGYILGYLNLRILTYPYLIIFLILWIYHFKNELFILKDSLKRIFQDKVLIVLIVTGIIILLTNIFPSGLVEPDGRRFYDINIIDGTYHLSLIQSLIRSVPPEEPGRVGTLVTNYHYWSDLVLAELVRIFKLPYIELFYQYFPIFLAIFYGLGAYQMGLTLTENKWTGRWFSFFVYYGGGLGYLFILILLGQLRFDTNSLDHSGILYTNPPRAIAQVVFLPGIIALYKWLISKNFKWGVVSGIILGTLVGFKVYAGMVAAFGLVGLFIYFLIKKEFRLVIPIMIAGIIASIIFFPTNPHTGGLFWAPLSWPKHYFAEGVASLLNWHLQDQTFVAYHNNLRIFILRAQMTISFLVITYGTRILGLFAIYFIFHKIDRKILIFLTTAILISNIIALLFLQKSGIYEIFNFFAVSALLLAFLLSVLLGDITNHLGDLTNSKKILTGFLLVIIIFLTIPHSLDYDYNALLQTINKNGTNKLFTNQELAFFSQVKYQIPENSVILVDPTDPLDKYTPYLAAFSSKRMYLSGRGVLGSHGLDTTQLNDEVVKMFTQTDPQVFSNFAHYKGINYIYFTRLVIPDMFYNSSFFKLVLRWEGGSLFEIE